MVEAIELRNLFFQGSVDIYNPHALGAEIPVTYGAKLLALSLKPSYPPSRIHWANFTRKTFHDEDRFMPRENLDKSKVFFLGIDLLEIGRRGEALNDQL